MLRLPASIMPSFLRPTPAASSILAQTRAFSSTPVSQAGHDKSKKEQTDPRITMIRYHMQHGRTPRPLRFSRMRALRHWTIHRAWQLSERKRRAQEKGELMRMHQSMASAMECLRTVDDVEGQPAVKSTGRLYRIALEKKGIFGREEGVPIEYARAQTDTPGRPGAVWNYEWVR